MRYRFPIYLLLAGVLLSACSQNGRLYRRAKKQFERANFESAVVDASKSLRLKPDNLKAQSLLVDAWNQTIQTRESNVSRFKNSNDPFKWEQVLSEYTALETLSSQLQTMPPLVNPETSYRVVLPCPDLYDKISESRENAAEARYQSALRYARMSNDMDTQKKAAQDFKEAMNLIPDYKDAQLKYQQSRKNAIKRIAIVPFEDKSSSRQRYGAISEMVTDHIISSIMGDNYNREFTEIITRSQMDAILAEQKLSASGLVSEGSSVNLGQILGAHEILTGKILQIAVTPERTVWVNQTAKAKVVVGREEYVNDEGKTEERDVMGEVTCDYRKFTKTAAVGVSGSFSIVDVETGRIKLQESIDIRDPWQDTWCRKLGGDERALNNNIKNLIEKTEPFPPAESEMVFTALRELGNSVVSKARGYLQ
ncbi:MAG: CsgG/HfaB family protein [Candidatus Cloacimonas sp.]|jgi:tetratricopeptide (TPR) repeat protein|nr:CsgG/HfaB family protein [Candidatus Cloacimonas sp.]